MKMRISNYQVRILITNDEEDGNPQRQEEEEEEERGHSPSATFTEQKTEAKSGNHESSKTEEKDEWQHV